MKRLLRLLIRCLVHPWTLVQIYRVIRDRHVIVKSRYFDKGWLQTQQTSTINVDENFVTQYILDESGNLNTSRDFVSAEYKMMHGINPRFTSPLAHYERIGKSRGYAISYRDAKLNQGNKHNCNKHASLSFDALESDRAETIARLSKKAKSGEKLRVAFLVFDASMFPAKPLFCKMSTDEKFDPKIIVIPDFRRTSRAEEFMESCYTDLVNSYGVSKIIKASQNKDGDWIDYLTESDLACYSTPYEISDIRYNPRWAMHLPLLSFYINYSYIVANFSLTIYRQESFSSFWKVFLENENALTEYSANSISQGANGITVGYLKMDDLDRIEKKHSPRKKIIIAPHHSFKGGYNDILAISNFLRFSDLFLALPEKYPNIDFVFRPHPFLRAALERDSIWGKDTTDKYFSTITSYHNVTLSVGDYMDEFANSDAMIQDCGSFLAEYFYTGKPQCYMLKSKSDAQRAFTPFGCKCIENCYQAFDEKDIIHFINDVVILGNDPKRLTRESFAKEITYNHPNAAGAALNYIKTILSCM